MWLATDASQISVIDLSQLKSSVQLLIGVVPLLVSVIWPPKPVPQSLVTSKAAVAAREVGAGTVSTMVPVPESVASVAPTASERVDLKREIAVGRRVRADRHGDDLVEHPWFKCQLSRGGGVIGTGRRGAVGRGIIDGDSRGGRLRQRHSEVRGRPRGAVVNGHVVDAQGRRCGGSQRDAVELVICRHISTHVSGRTIEAKFNAFLPVRLSSSIQRS